jgi:hypothetical protein
MAEFDISSPSAREQALRSIRPETAKRHQALLRQIFQAEFDYRRKDEDHEYFENIYWCAYLLFHVGDPDDTESMWLAKHLNMDTGCGFDIENLVGGGVEQTVAHLRQHGINNVADDIAERFAGCSREEIEEWSRDRQRYFYGA